jgi:hypothetical protein
MNHPRILPEYLNPVQQKYEGTVIGTLFLTNDRKHYVAVKRLGQGNYHCIQPVCVGLWYRNPQDALVYLRRESVGNAYDARTILDQYKKDPADPRHPADPWAVDMMRIEAEKFDLQYYERAHGNWGLNPQTPTSFLPPLRYALSNETLAKPLNLGDPNLCQPAC